MILLGGRRRVWRLTQLRTGQALSFGEMPLISVAVVQWRVQARPVRPEELRRDLDSTFVAPKVSSWLQVARDFRWALHPKRNVEARACEESSAS